VDLDGEVMPGIVPLIYKKGKTRSLGTEFVLLDGILIVTRTSSEPGTRA
jgi:hypothetical protein